MCDQTELIYSPGDVVWVKLGRVWWPGQVQDYEKLPEDIIQSLQRKPIAVVKFFQEDSYEYVKNLNSIYHYNCRKKQEFIKKGLDMCRSNNNDVPSNMKMFPNDIATAEHLTNGNPNILESEEFAPDHKEDYSDLFGKKTLKKSKTDSSRKFLSWRIKGLAESSVKSKKHSLPTPISRPITHPRFINKALEGGRSDHDVRIRQQLLENDRNSSGTFKMYNCHLCSFSSSRLNVIILHNKAHNAGFADAYLSHQKLSSKGRKSKGMKKQVYSSEKRKRVSDVFKCDQSPIKRKKIKPQCEGSENYTDITISESSVISQKNTSIKKPVFGRRKTKAKDKAEKLAKEKQQNDAFRETLLKDWDEDDKDDDGSKEDVLKESHNSGESSLNSSDINIARGEKNDSKNKEVSCFDFDDSEDGLNISETVMKFGQKIPRILGDKHKKQSHNSSDESLVEKCNAFDAVEKYGEETNISRDFASEDSVVNEDTKNKEAEDLQSAINSLLDETEVPIVPDPHLKLNLEKNTDKNILETKSDNKHNEVDDSNQVDCDLEKNNTQKIFENISHSENSVTYKNNEHVTNDKDTFLDPEHFLVKTSEEVATYSSDNQNLEEKNYDNNVAIVSKEPSDLELIQLKGNEPSAEMIINNEVSDVKLIESNLSTANESGTSITFVNQENSKASQDNTNSNTMKADFEILKSDTDESTNISEQEYSKPVFESGVDNDSVELQNTIIKTEKQPFISDAVLKLDNKTTVSFEDKSFSDKINLNIECHATSKTNNFQEMDFDINSMPVILSEEIGQDQVTDITESFDKSSGVISKSNMIVSNKQSEKINENQFSSVENVTKNIKDLPANTNMPDILNEGVHSDAAQNIFNKTPEKVLVSPKKVIQQCSSQIATIKLQPNTSVATKLSVPGGVISQKNISGASQVLILKSTTGQSSKSTLQKINNASHIIQQSGKVLILTNPQGSPGQSKIVSPISLQSPISTNKHTGNRVVSSKGPNLSVGSPGNLNKSSPSKTVTTKSGQKILINKGTIASQTPKSVIINKSGICTSSVSNKSRLEPIGTSHLNLSQIVVSSKGNSTTILTTPGFSSNKNLILTPVSSNNKGVIASNQKVRLITASKSSHASLVSSGGTKLMIQNSPSKMILPTSLNKNQQLKLVGNLKSQSGTGTILIQTSQGVIATTPLTSNPVLNKNKLLKSSTSSVIGNTVSTNKTIQIAQSVSPVQNKLVVQKVKSSGPNILQKSLKKSIQRSNKRVISNQLTPVSTTTLNVQSTSSIADITHLPSSSQERLILSSNLPVADQSTTVVSNNNQLDSPNHTALVYLAVDESGNYRPLQSTSVNYESGPTNSQTLFINPGTNDLDNIYLAIDDAGNVVNIAQSASNTLVSENTSTPSQDILAKALANTQVLQQETLISENLPLTSSIESSVLGGCMFVEPQTQYPQPSLSNNVLETSLTLNQPIMTPLEVPSSVSPRSLDNITSLQSSFLSDSILSSTSSNTVKKSQTKPAIQLLSGNSIATSGENKKRENVYFTKVGETQNQISSVTSNPQIAYQFALDSNNVIVSSTDITSLGVVSSIEESQNNKSFVSQSNMSKASDSNYKQSFISENSISPSVFTSVSHDNVNENFHLISNIPDKAEFSTESKSIVDVKPCNTKEDIDNSVIPSSTLVSGDNIITQEEKPSLADESLFNVSHKSEESKTSYSVELNKIKRDLNVKTSVGDVLDSGIEKTEMQVEDVNLSYASSIFTGDIEKNVKKENEDASYEMPISECYDANLEANKIKLDKR